MILVTGASGHLGRLVISSLLAKGVKPENIVAMVRSANKVADLANKGIQVREADYTDSTALDSAFRGVSRALLISSSEVGQRFAQHMNVIKAAKSAAVEQLVYTSILNATQSVLALAKEHQQTEAALVASGLNYVILRNGWYLENYTENAGPVIESGLLAGAAGNGKVSAASRADYAEAAATVLTTDVAAGSVFELAGDISFTMEEYAVALSTASGKPVTYQDMPKQAYEELLVEIGVPGPFANILADSDAGIATGALFNETRQLSTLIGRPTTSIEQAITDLIRS